MSDERIAFEGELWRHDGAAAWHFVTLPVDLADEIRARRDGAHRPFGSLAVQARIGATTWATSIFADSKSLSYVLPVKAQVRKREGLEQATPVRVEIELS